MEKLELLERSKNDILNVGVILLALFIAFQIYKSTDEKVTTLKTKQNDELKKNEVMDEISILEKKVEKYQRFFAKKDMSYVVNAISDIARNCSINITSIRPSGQEAGDDYTRPVFLLVLTAPDYHSLGKFISQIEDSKDVYMVGGVSIASGISGDVTGGNEMNLKVTLRISTISY